MSIMSNLKPFIIEETVTTTSVTTVIAKDAKQAQEYFKKDINISDQVVNSNTSVSIFKQEGDI